MKHTEKESLYLLAKAEYYKGTPIMSDEKFDKMENLLTSSGSTITETVGFQDDDPLAKFKHPSPMLSMSKYQADGYKSYDEFLTLVDKWMEKTGDGWYEASPKFDGNAVNLIYKNGNLVAGLTRSTGTHGRDITSKCINNPTIPKTIPANTKIVEVRCEIVYPIDKFKILNEYRAAQGLELFSNERNFVAGVLRDEKASQTEINNLVFFAIGGFQYLGTKNYLSFKSLFQIGFNTINWIYTIEFQRKDFQRVYNDMEKYRTISNFRLDGFVLSVKSKKVKKVLGENKHDPNWAKAIKFPAQLAQTTIKDIEWNLARDGEMIPVAIMTPTPLDGSVVSRATMVNYGHVTKNKYYPGAVVTIRKAGDIIPQITSLISAAGTSSILPHRCPSCQNILSIEGIHLMCNYSECKAKGLGKFIHSVGILDIFGLGESQLEKIYDAGVIISFDLLNPNKFNKDNLISTDHFKAGRALDKIFIEVEKIKSITLIQIFRMLEIENLGRSISKQLANEYCMIDADYKGLDRSVVLEGQNSFERVSKIISKLNTLNINIEYPKKEEIMITTTIKVEFTGSPKSFGYKTKADFLDAANQLGDVRQTKLAAADYLIADNIDGTSSKIKTAHKKGIKVISYSDLIDTLSK